MASITVIRNNFRSGQIPREQFWMKMQESHIRLRELQNQIDGTEVDHIEIHGDNLLVVTRQGIKMVWEPEDVCSVANGLVNYGMYEEESELLIESGLGASVILDVGANAGYYSLRWGAKRVYAFEPVPSNFALLQKNVALNFMGWKIIANNFGLGAEAKTVTMFIPSIYGPGGASLRNIHPEQSATEIQVQIYTLDYYFKHSGLSRLDLLKVDVEGGELGVLKGGWETINEYKPLIFLELLRKWAAPFGYHPNDVIKLLAGIGYQCYTFDAGKLVRFHEMNDSTKQKNFFFAHHDKHQNWI